MCGALETSPPSDPKTAQEKSRRSFIFVDIDVLCKTLEQKKLIKFEIKKRFVFFLNKLPAHLFSNAHKTMRKYTQMNRVQFCCDIYSHALANCDANVTLRCY